MRPRPDTPFGTAARASSGRVSVLVMMLSLLSTDVSAQQAHEHGGALLNVALDGKKLVVQLESPLDNLVGFEHAPRNDKQRAALAKMEESLQAGDRWFKPAAAAGCTLRDVKVEHPYRTPSAAGQPSPDTGKRPRRRCQGQSGQGRGAARRSARIVRARLRQAGGPRPHGGAALRRVPRHEAPQGADGHPARAGQRDTQRAQAHAVVLSGG